jgi:hypothetical protein
MICTTPFSNRDRSLDMGMRPIFHQLKILEAKIEQAVDTRIQ